MTTSNKTSDNEWQQVVQRVTTSGTTNDNKWQRVAILANSYFFFFRIREESTTKHPKNYSFNLKGDLDGKRDIKLRAEGSP